MDTTIWRAVDGLIRSQSYLWTGEETSLLDLSISAAQALGLG